MQKLLLIIILMIILSGLFLNIIFTNSINKDDKLKFKY